MQSSRAAAGQEILRLGRPFRPLPSPSGGNGFLGYYGGKSWPPTLKAGGLDQLFVKQLYIWGGDFTLEGGGILRRFTGLLSQGEGEGFLGTG
jgi:hypothetical protein